MSKIKKIINRHILYFVLICLFIFIMKVFDLQCPMKSLLGIPCPTCGVTRAFFALLNGDIEGYFFYHPLAVPLICSVLLMLHIKLFQRKRGIYSFTMLVLAINLALYIVRLILQYEL